MCDAIRHRRVSRVLDLGCNIAALGQVLFALGYAGEYLGIDNNPYSLAEADLALAGRGCRFMRANVRSLPMASGFSDCVVVKDVLEHLEDFRVPFREAARLARKYLVVANFIPWTDGKTVLRREPQGYFCNTYNRQEVYSYAREHGLEVEDVIATLEKDGRANEVVIFCRRDDDTLHEQAEAGTCTA